MTAQAMGMRDAQRMLALRVGPSYVAVPVRHVVETMRPLRVEAIREAPVCVLGLAIIRGRPVPVIDASVIIGSSRAAAPFERFVVLRVDERHVALAVDGVVGLRGVANSTLEAWPPLAAHPYSANLTAIGLLDAASLVVLETARVLPEAAWAAFEAHMEPPP
jgi:purine-binding chemotaxis protein CheW